MKERNEGISLIELIVVVAIMMVLTSAFVLSLSLVGRRRVSNAATTFKQTFQLAQTYTKSRGACKVTIKGTSNSGYNVYIYTAENTTDLEYPNRCKEGNGPNNISNKISITIVFSDGTKQPLGAGESVDFFLKRTTGGVQKAVFNRANGSKIDNKVPQKIEFSNGDKTTVLVIATNTGVITYE